MTLGLLTDTVANQMAKKADLSNRKGLEELLLKEVVFPIPIASVFCGHLEHFRP